MPSAKKLVLLPINNALLAQAAANGFTQGVYLQSAATGSEPDASDDDIAAQAASFALAVDAAIPADPLITSSDGQAIVPTDSPTLEAQLGKMGLLTAICAAKTQAYAVGSLLVNGIPADTLADLVADVVSAYTPAAARVFTP